MSNDKPQTTRRHHYRSSSYTIEKLRTIEPPQSFQIPTTAPSSSSKNSNNNMASMRATPRKSPTYGNGSAATEPVLVPTRRMRRRGNNGGSTVGHGTSRGTSRRLLRRQRRTYKTLFIICLGISFLAFVYIVRNGRSDGLGDDDYDMFVRRKRIEKQEQREMRNQGEIKNFGFDDGIDKNGAVTNAHPEMPKTDKEKVDLILQGKVTLINLNASKNLLQKAVGYEGVLAQFCFLDFTEYRKDPSSYPMFRDLVYKQCKPHNSFTYDLHTIVKLATAYDTTAIRALEPSAFIFHESRCGSTLIANALTAMSPSDHIVYSESQPALAALKVCGIGGKQCPPYRAVELFQDVVYLMGRTADPTGEKKLFFKIQSMATKYISVAVEAFPDTPWVFVYRDPVQVMMSQFQRGVRSAICVRQLVDVPKEAIEVLKGMGKKIRDLNPFEKCAFHLSTLCEAALNSLSQSNGQGIAVNYEGITNKLIDTVFPDHFQLEMTEEKRQRIIEVSGHYSKSRGPQKGKEWKEDSEEKEDMATPKIREACELFLYSNYNSFENEDAS